MRFFRLQNEVQHYDWGTTDIIPNLLGISNHKEIPYAELWMGTHASAPSYIITDAGKIPLADQLQEDMATDLPFLFKLLSSRLPLSIQLHPDKKQAEAGYAREEISEHRPRLYRDRNHKPEMLAALNRVYALCSFRNTNDIVADLAAIPIFREKVLEAGRENQIADVFRRVLSLEEPQQCIADLCSYAELHSRASHDKFWWITALSEYFPNDISCVAPLFLNLVRLEPGEGLFIAPREIHAYLQGSGLEIMAPSDNVLRAGCTKKPVDVDELLKVASFEPHSPQILQPAPASQCEQLYPIMAEEFELSRIDIPATSRVQGKRLPLPEILLCIHGNLTLRAADSSMQLQKGDSIYIPPKTADIQFSNTDAEAAILYRASCPGAAGQLLMQS